MSSAPFAAPPVSAPPVSAPPVSGPFEGGTGHGTPTAAVSAVGGSPFSAPPQGSPVSAPPQGAPPFPVQPLGTPTVTGPYQGGASTPGRPVSAPPGPGYPPVGAQPPTAPVSAAPISASPVPPWGLTAPPWSSVAPSQPVERKDGPGPEPAADEGAEVDQGPVGPTAPQAQESEEGRPRSLPVYDELLEFPESTHPEADPQTYPEQQGVWPEVPAPFHQPPAYPVDLEEPEPRGRNRTVVAVAVGAAVVAVVAAVGVGAVVLNRDAAPEPTPPPATGGVKPKVSGPPPGDLKLRDDTSTITVTWTDPSKGGVPFVVAGGRAGQKLGVMATVDAGTTTYTVNGLNPKLDYCFTVLAVYSTDTYATSGQVCTDRQGAAPN